MHRLLAIILLFTFLLANGACRKKADNLTSGPPEPQAQYYLMYQEGERWIYHQRHEETVCRTAQGFCTTFSTDAEEIYLYIHLSEKLSLTNLHQLQGAELGYDTHAKNFVWWYASEFIMADSVAGNFVITEIGDLDSTDGERNRIISGTFKAERYSTNQNLHHLKGGRYRFRVYE